MSESSIKHNSWGKCSFSFLTSSSSFRYGWVFHVLFASQLGNVYLFAPSSFLNFPWKDQEKGENDRGTNSIWGIPRPHKSVTSAITFCGVGRIRVWAVKGSLSTSWLLRTAIVFLCHNARPHSGPHARVSATLPLGRGRSSTLQAWPSTWWLLPPWTIMKPQSERRSANTAECRDAFISWLQTLDTGFFSAGMHAFVHRFNRCSEKCENYWEDVFTPRSYY